MATTSGRRARRRQLPRGQEVLEAGLALFAERGYHGTTVRDIARAVGIRAPGLYSHIESKQDLLKAIMDATMERLIADHHAAISTTNDVAEALRRATEAHVRYHCRHRQEALVGNRELASLDEPTRGTILALRDDYEQGFRALIARGIAEGRFDVGSPRLASYSILEMGIGVAVWYRDDGEFSEAQIAYQYADFALRLVGADGGGGSRQTPPGQPWGQARS